MTASKKITLLSVLTLILASGCSSKVNCDSAKMVSATKLVAEGVESACGELVELGVGGKCMEEAVSELRKIYSDEEMACVSRNLKGLNI